MSKLQLHTMKHEYTKGQRFLFTHADGEVEEYKITRIGTKYIYCISNDYGSDGYWFFVITEGTNSLRRC